VQNKVVTNAINSLNENLAKHKVEYETKVNSLSNLQDSQHQQIQDIKQTLNNFKVEQEVNESANPVSSKAVKTEFNKFSTAYDKIIQDKQKECKDYTDQKIEGVTQQHNELKQSFVNHQMSYETRVQSLERNYGALNTKVTNIETSIGDIETALDSIIAIQNGLIGG
jgi:chromosome segregation ATPase